METKNKKNNQTWIKAKSLPIGRGIKQNARKSLGNQPKSKNVQGK